MKTFIIWGPQEMLPFVNDACKLIHDNIHRFNIDEVKRINKVNKSKRALARKKGADNNNISTIEQMKNHHKYFIEPLLRDLHKDFSNLEYWNDYQTLNYRDQQHNINRANLHWKLCALGRSKDYSSKNKGTMYKRRLNNLTKRMEYQIQKLKKLGTSPVAVIDLVLKEKINNSSTFIEIKKRFTLVDLTR